MIVFITGKEPKINMFDFEATNVQGICIIHMLYGAFQGTSRNTN